MLPPLVDVTPFYGKCRPKGGKNFLELELQAIEPEQPVGSKLEAEQGKLVQDRAKMWR